jgi:hypothetical protein
MKAEPVASHQKNPERNCFEYNAAGYFITMSSLKGQDSGASGFLKNKQAV